MFLTARVRLYRRTSKCSTRTSTPLSTSQYPIRSRMPYSSNPAENHALKAFLPSDSRMVRDSRFSPAILDGQRFGRKPESIIYATLLNSSRLLELDSHRL